MLLARKFLLVFVAIMFTNNPTFQGCCALTAMVVSYALHVKHNPFLDASEVKAAAAAAKAAAAAAAEAAAVCGGEGCGGGGGCSHVGEPAAGHEFEPARGVRCGVLGCDVCVAI